jgi:hypothetical protein
MNDQAPTTPEPPKDPNIVGTLNEEEMKKWANVRQASNQGLIEIGNFFVRALRMAGQIEGLQESLQTMLKEVAARIGIPPEQQFQVLPSGEIRAIAPKPVPPAAEPPEEPAEAPSVTPEEEAKAETAKAVLAAQAAAAVANEPAAETPAST